MKFLFAIPKNPLNFFGYKGILQPVPHLGIAYLISCLEKEGVDVKVFDDSWGESLEDTIHSFLPDYVGVSIYSISAHFAYELIKRIRHMSDATIIVGGPHVTTLRADIYQQIPEIDFPIYFEAEQKLPQLLMGKNPVEGFIQDLDSIPFPNFDHYRIPVHPLHKRKIVPIITSRGCPFQCNFCSVRLYMGSIYRKHSAENVLEEMRFQYAKGYTMFDINDDCFTLDRERAIRILDGILDSDMDLRLEFVNGLRADCVDRELLYKLKRAGCYYISYGCESGSEQILKRIKKGLTLPVVERAVEMTKDVGIHCSVNFIVGHSTETYEDGMDTIRFANKLKSDFVNFYSLIPYPDTVAYDLAKKEGSFLVNTSNYLEEITYCNEEPVFHTPEFSKEQRMDIIRQGKDITDYRVLTYRFGKLGILFHFLFTQRFIKRFAGWFATQTRLGKWIAESLARRSYA